ncbi:SDR family NAD(P)-dependent oxidoreductase [Siccirubricoccus sp. G192]|uniref:SDR family NAD(P)-dependent oxidoreductase n=1 Tax=Siccirubricoccus sp. G192 TaxID=2849651 RepID=UPI001C2BECB1|nr:SDR family NAD(P)-dependent oxidoreductase [Siccirubricoccus sp. G192]MBV1797913.1 SDR family NAD(P)-dependent oxidoreductase [Siccirubricoccus sp. G192]
MDVRDVAALVTGGASGLGLATARRLIARGARVVLCDLPGSRGADVAAELGQGTRFAPADVADEASMQAAVAMAEGLGPLRVLVHCAGRGGSKRILDREGAPMPLEHFQEIIRVNLTGSFNVLRLAAAAMARTAPVAGEGGVERGVCIMTASIAGYEGQIGQSPYATSKAGVIGLTLVAARDLASRHIRVCTIAPGIFDTPLLGRLPEPVRQALNASVPNPARLGVAEEYAMLAMQILENPYLNGETIRLDGALRMPPR